MTRQANRRALVIGGAGGIGATVVGRLRADGAEVLTAGLEATDIIVDVADPASVEVLAAEAGRIDVLVNSAGALGRKGPLAEIADREWERSLAVNLTGVFLACRAFAPAMAERGWGRIVNIASAAGMEGVLRNSAYSAAKGGVIAFTRSIGKEFAATGVLVNAVAPGLIATPMTDVNPPDVISEMLSRVPMGRAGRPDEVAELVAWLCSDRMSYSAGAVFDASGGRLSW
jgi:NAD(P)-dependent dehydrogenase (short-subunit alcohol dehydrogenase family)